MEKSGMGQLDARIAQRHQCGCHHTICRVLLLHLAVLVTDQRPRSSFLASYIGTLKGARADSITSCVVTLWLHCFAITEGLLEEVFFSRPMEDWGLLTWYAKPSQVKTSLMSITAMSPLRLLSLLSLSGFISQYLPIRRSLRSRNFVGQAIWSLR